MPTDQPRFDDSWETDHSSGFLTSYIGTVESGYFATSEKQPDALSLHWVIDKDTVRSVDPDLEVVLPDGDLTERYSCGKGWATHDGGETAEHPTKRKFSDRSLYGAVIETVMAEDYAFGEIANPTSDFDGKIALDGCRSELADRQARAYNADAFVGMTFQFEEYEFDYGTDDDGRKMSSTRNVPVRFVGDGAAKATKPKAKAAKKAAKKKGKAAPAADPDTITDEARAAMVELAGEADDFAAYVDACLANTTIAEDQIALADLTDEDTAEVWNEVWSEES
ncbi:MAG: hypothetical protein GY773_09795 [Actinomycetia bacterium]|nr:hypothetical protein [Actinomycetes bacterium]